MTYTIRLAGETPSLNTILRWKSQGQHWRYSQLRDNWCLEVRARLNEQGIFFTNSAHGKIHVHIERHCAGTLDDDNLRGGCKPLLDALKKERAIFDDSPKWLHATYSQVKAKRGEGFTVITISRGATVTQQLGLALADEPRKKTAASGDVEF